ncbi:dermonecrotic toxin domain-containing protein [Pseudomonas sp. SDO52101_S400]
MVIERLLLNIAGEPPVPLAGAFVIGETPDDKGLILYTPYAGIQKFHNRADLKERLEERLNNIDEQDKLLPFLALSLRQRLLDAERISITFASLTGDVFAEHLADFRGSLLPNAEMMCEELKKLPTLPQLLDAVLDELLRPHFGSLAQNRTQVSFNRLTGDSGERQHISDLMSLSDAVLMYYRHQYWPAEQRPRFSNPGRTPATDDQEQWENAVTQAASKLPALLFRHLERYWEAPSALGLSRRALFAQALEDQAHNEWMFKRESGVIDSGQFNTLQQLIRPVTQAVRFPVVENVRLWEREANYVELAGSLMISEPHAFLYTPSHGLQLLKDYDDLKETLKEKFIAKGHEDELYGLLSLDERNRFLGFGQPQVSGERIVGDIFRILFESIITKQRQNIEYALQVFRHSDGAVNLHALLDKSMDIRSTIHERLQQIDMGGRWSTHPVISGNQQPSVVLADKALAAIKTFDSVATPILEQLRVQPMANLAIQRYWLERLKPDLAQAWFVGVNGEARLRLLDGSLNTAVQAIVSNVINADQPSRAQRSALNGFRPDAYAVTLECSAQPTPVPLAHCLFITERGGLDEQHSGRAVLWTPALGLEVFDSVAVARQALKRRLSDSDRRLFLLENIVPSQYQPHQRYSLGPFQYIDGNVLHECVQSAIGHYLDRCQQVRERIKDTTRRDRALEALRGAPLHTNLPLASAHARAIATQQTLPAWLGMAPVQDQKLHVELLEQWYQSVTDDKDYLSGVPSLVGHVEQTLKSMLDSRFPDSRLDPHEIEIAPNLALAGPARSLVEFALNHINVAQGTGFRIASKNARTLPAGLDQTAVTQMLLSLAIPTTYARKVVQALSANDPESRERKQRFFRQLPWQLLQHAHAAKLQQHLSDSAFNLIQQVLDMPDALARAAVHGAHAIASPLSLIKTARATAVSVQGMYVFSPGNGHKGPLVLYAPYAEQVFQEFENEKSLIAALNMPGLLQDLLLRRLHDSERAIFRNLLESSVGQTSEMKLATNAIEGNLLEYLYNDNLVLLEQQLGTQKSTESQFDWETVKILLSQEIRQLGTLLPGKLGYIPVLWKAYDRFKDSAEALQNHHWKRALKSFIQGAEQMVLVGLLPEASGEAEVVVEEVQESAGTAELADIDPTAPQRTMLQSYESVDIALKDLKFTPGQGTYLQVSRNRHFAAVDGKVYPVVKSGNAWRLANSVPLGPTFQKNGPRMVRVADHQTVHYGQAFGRLVERNTYTNLRRTMLNIEAQGMDEIRLKFPLKARALVHAVDLARRYAFYCLHNLVPLANGPIHSRVSHFLEDFFNVPTITPEILSRINAAILPICNALVDPSDELLNTDRFVVGSNKLLHDVIAFVLDGDTEKRVHFTEHFFKQQLDHYKPFMFEQFDVDGHAQASTLIHEFSHQFSNTLDITTLRAREPFSDLISTITSGGLKLYNELENEQKSALSLSTPRAQLFAEWNTVLKDWVDVDKVPGMELIHGEILRLTGARNLREARNAFLDQQSPDARINVILRNADSIARLICEVGRQLDPAPAP